MPSNVRCAELGDIKASFEQGGKKKYTEEELEAKKKANLEREFKRIQKEKRILKEKERREIEEAEKEGLGQIVKVCELFFFKFLQCIRDEQKSTAHGTGLR